MTNANAPFSTQTHSSASMEATGFSRTPRRLMSRQTAFAALAKIDELRVAVDRVLEGATLEEIPVTGDDNVSELAGGIRSVLEELCNTKNRLAEKTAKVSAIETSQAMIEFELDGTILNANENFLTAVGYTLDEVRGHHHRMFVDPGYAATMDYTQFWAELGRGQYKAGEFQRFAKGGKEIWIQASYNPILDSHGIPYKVVKFATDITAAKRRSADQDGQLQAISKSQAVIEFEVDSVLPHHG